MDIKEKLIDIFKSRPAGPFLFIGSGFSRRYLGLEDWKGLLEKFCVAGKPFEYYLALANGEYPAAANILSKDFNEYWWTSEEYKTSANRFKSKISDQTSALRIEICNHLSKLDQTVAKNSKYAEEVKLLSSLNVDGIITTNWDIFLEQLFPEYKVFIGQNELLFSNPQEIAEIYKIHGCSSRPHSLILTDKDYEKFNEINPYLAAKLITLFVEHPIVFIGYSISDPNISSLLRAISSCIGKEKVEQLRRNLIFVDRTLEGEEAGISDTYLTIDGVQIPLILVKTDDFIPIYQAIDVTKRKIPARILRYCKEQLYELVKSTEPEKKLCVVDIDEIERKEDIEFLVGVGIAANENIGLSTIGYAAIEAKDLFSDLLYEDRNYDAQQIIEHVIPRICKSTPNIPIYKYLQKIGITSKEQLLNNTFKCEKILNRTLNDFRSRTYARPFLKKYKEKSIQEIIDECTPENASAYIPFLAPEKIDIETLKNFLIQNIEKVDYQRSNYASSFRKLIALYDRLAYGW